MHRGLRHSGFFDAGNSPNAQIWDIWDMTCVVAADSLYICSVYMLQSIDDSQ